MSEKISVVATILVAGIGDPRQSLFSRIGCNIGPATGKQRSRKNTRPKRSFRLNAAQPVHPAAAKQPVKDCFNLIISVMPRHQNITRSYQTCKPGVSRVTARRFVQMVPCRRYQDGLADLNAPLTANLHTVDRPSARPCLNRMIHMERKQSMRRQLLA